MEIKGKMYVRANKWHDKWLYSTRVPDEGDQKCTYLNVDFTKNPRAKIKELGLAANDKNTIEIDVTWAWLKAYNGKVRIVIHDLEKVKGDKDKHPNEYEES